MQKLKNVYRYLLGTGSRQMILGGIGKYTLFGYADASYAGDLGWHEEINGQHEACAEAPDSAPSQNVTAKKMTAANGDKNDLLWPSARAVKTIWWPIVRQIGPDSILKIQTSENRNVM